MPTYLNRIIAWSIVLLWMLFIFNLSGQKASKSHALSSTVTEIIVETVEKISPDSDFDIKRLHLIIRKNAHFLAYLVLGSLVLGALRRSGVHGIRSFVFALGICLIYAVFDEIHQTYVSGRSGEIRDVLIDGAGAMVGIGLYGLIRRKEIFGGQSI